MLLEYFPSISDYEDLLSTYIANCTFNGFLSYTAIVLNIIAIHAIRKTSSLPRPLRTLLVSLAVSHVGVGLLVQPFYILLLVKWLQQRNRGCVTYKALTTIGGFFSTASLTFFGVVVISIDRFLAIHFHLRYKELVTHKRVVAVVITVWVLSAVLSMLWFSVDIHHAILSSVGVVCLLLTAVVYSRIYVVLRRHHNQIHAMQVQQVTQDCNEMARLASIRKSAACTFYAYVLFLISYTPFLIFLIAFKLYGPSISMNRLSLYSGTLMFLNSSLNPVIYCWKMKHIRRTVMDILRNLMSLHRNR
ncbi:beta-4C adrenergic receptor-like [Oculina patagonica]